jgi:hypothetical protein
MAHDCRTGSSKQAPGRYLNDCFKGFFCQPLYAHVMSFAEFIAACFWPIVILFGILIVAVRDDVLLRCLVWVGGVTGMLYFGLWVFFAHSSIIAVVDACIFVGVIGFVFFGYGCLELRRRKPGVAAPLKERLVNVGVLLLGAGLVWMSASTLFLDFFRPHLVVEGRVDMLRTSGGRQPDHLADIAGRTVKVTTPVYERLKFKPYVRVEVGRGSNYVYLIEYLAN